MFGHQPDSKANSPERRLATVLKHYVVCADSDPNLLREKIPAQDVWRLFVEGHLQQNGQWFDFEKREPNYLKAMYGAFHGIFNSENTLCYASILRLHAAVLKQVANTAYAEINEKLGYAPEAGVGELRADDYAESNVGALTIFAGKKKNASVEGIMEMLRRPDQGGSLRRISLNIYKNKFSTSEDIILTDELIAALRAGVLSIKEDKSAESYGRIAALLHPFAKNGYVDKKFFLSLFKKSKGNAREVIEPLDALMAIGKTTDDRSLAICLLDLARPKKGKVIELALISKQPQNCLSTLGAEMNGFIKNYQQGMSQAGSPIDKLRCIVKLVQELEQQHPFVDANCRTFCMLMLNYLLIHNGFPLAIMENPNRFDLYSRSELLDEVINGMENTFELIQTNALFNISTDSILARLRENAYLLDSDLAKDQLQYFMGVTELEQANRCERQLGNSFNP